MQRLEVERHVALLRDFECVLNRVGDFGEERLHLLRAAQIKLFLHVAHPLGVRELRLRAEADQAIVRVRMLLLDVMHVVRRDAFQTELLCPRDEMPVDLRLLGDAVVLELEIEVIRTKRLLEPIDGRARLRQVVLDDGVGDLARETAGERDEPAAVLGEDFLVDARLVIIPVEMRRRDELREVLVAFLILCEQHEMVVDVTAAATGRLLLQPRSGRDIHLAADDGLDALLLRRLVEIHRGVKHAVVSHRHGVELEVVRLVHQLVETTGGVEQAVLGMQMEMDKVRVRHWNKFTVQRNKRASRHPGKLLTIPSSQRQKFSIEHPSVLLILNGVP